MDIHTPMAEFLNASRKKNKDFSLHNDGIHPKPLGHLLMAKAFLTKFDLWQNTTSLDMPLEELQLKISNDPLFKLINKRGKVRSTGWLNYVGYTRKNFFLLILLTTPWVLHKYYKKK